VLQGVTMLVPDAACTTVLGRNGMGKTTMIRTLMGLNPAAAGEIRFDGTLLNRLEPNQIARLGLALVPQGRHVFASLSVEENMTLGARKNPDGQGELWTLERIYDFFPNLKERRRLGAGQLSGGEQQMLAIGRALMTNPRLILMDEPSEGLAPVIVERVGEVIRLLRDQKLSILLVEQNYRLGVDSGDHIYILSKGVVVWSGSAADLEGAEDVRRTHLGV
jgi:branched-chain amino acid transport system ATP-binding protein